METFSFVRSFVPSFLWWDRFKPDRPAMIGPTGRSELGFDRAFDLGFDLARLPKKFPGGQLETTCTVGYKI